MAKVGQDIFHARGIDRSLFCSECCYNLKTRPIIGRCPECGQQYDARGGSRRGILEPEIIHWPVGDMLITLITAGISGAAISMAVIKKAPWFLAWGIPFLLMTYFLARGTWRKLRYSWRSYRLQREAQLREDDDD